MRPFRLACIAAEAESVRLRRMVGRIVVRATLLVVALLFLLGAIAFVHLAAWYWLRTGSGRVKSISRLIIRNLSKQNPP